MRLIILLFDLWRMQNSTKKSKKYIQKQQQKALQKLMLYVYEQSDYYKKEFDKLGITKEAIKKKSTDQKRFIKQIPVMDKKILLDHYNEIITVDDVTQNELKKFDEDPNIDNKVFHEKYHIVHSSGSSGSPAYFIYDNRAWERLILGIIRSAFWNVKFINILKYLREEPRIVFIAAVNGRYGGAMAVGDGIQGVKAKQLFLDVNEPIESWKKKLEEFRPNMFIGYPSALKILGDMVSDKAITIEENIFRVITCGEPLCENMRKYFKKIFHTSVVNVYGASESLALGVEVDQQEGMILFDDMNYIEIEDGTMYLTCLYNYAQPIIRYKLKDKLEQIEANDKNAFSYTKGIIGRDEDLMWFLNKEKKKEFIHPLSIEGFHIEGLKDYQFIQHDEHSFSILIECEAFAEHNINSQKKSREECKIENNDRIAKKLRKQMNRILKEKNLDNLFFDIKEVYEIQADTQTGKKSLIINI